MQFFAIQIVMFIGAFIAFNYYKLGLRYFCIFLTPFYAMAILGIGGGVSTNILPIHLFGFGLICWAILTRQRIRRGELVRYFLVMLPFVLSLIYNYFFFAPVEAWEIQADQISGGKRVVMKYSLSLTNFTQLAYLVFAGIMALVYSSIRIEKRKVKTTVDVVLFVVAFLGILQLIAFYSGFHGAYKLLFNTTDANMADQVFIWGIKRINACFQEPSYLGHFIFFTMCFYLLAFGYQSFIKSKAVWAGTLVGIASTATTFYLGFGIILVYLYLYHATSKEKMWYYILAVLLMPVLIYAGQDGVMEYINAKEGSTNNRFYLSWTVAWEGIKASPFFGIGYGTHRPLFVYTILLSAVGIFGTIIFIYAFLQGKTNKNMRHYLALCFAIGIGSFELPRHEMWILFGLLSNPWLYQDTDSS